VSDDDKTPPPTRNPFAGPPEDTHTAVASEPKVEVAEDLLAEDRAPPPRRPPPGAPPSRPGIAINQVATGARPGLPPRRPAPVPPPRATEEVDGEDDDLDELNGGSEKTQIRAPPSERPKR
jgi:pilus assembly protein CpaF